MSNYQHYCRIGPSATTFFFNSSIILLCLPKDERLTFLLCPFSCVTDCDLVCALNGFVKRSFLLKPC